MPTKDELDLNKYNSPEERPFPSAPTPAVTEAQPTVQTPAPTFTPPTNIVLIDPQPGSIEDRDRDAQEMIAQGRSDDTAASQAENDRELNEPAPEKPAAGKPLHEAEAEGRKLLAEQEAEKTNVEKVDPLGKIGDDVSYIADNGHMYPAKVTSVDNETGTVSLAIFYKSSLSFVSGVSSAEQKRLEDAKRERGEVIEYGRARTKA